MKNLNLKITSVIMFTMVLLVSGLFINSSTAIAADASLSSQSFVTWNQGGLVGYDAGFTLTNATFDQASSVIIQLYSGNTLLQTNVAINGKLKGDQFLTPFDVFGTFNYASDGYFTNTKASEYGQTLIPTKVVATVTLADSTVLTTTNTNLTGDTSIISKNGKVLGAEKFQFTQKIKISSQGNEVIELQKLLNTSGFDCGIVDGKFGPKTKAAIMKFQTANKLQADGVVGPLTRAVLNK